MKKCTKCGIKKSADQFFNHRIEKDGLHSQCKDCCATRMKASRKLKKTEGVCIRPGCKNIPEPHRVVCKQHLQKQQLANLQNSGVPPGEISRAEIALKSFNGVCAICGTTQFRGRRGWTLDHNHKTKKFRGILCDRCNKLLGFAGDSSAVLNQAILYLEKNQ